MEQNEFNTNEENDHGEKFANLMQDAGAELYPGCKTFSKLSFILKLFRLKCLHSWTARSFNMLLELLVDAFPKGVLLPKSTYEVKKIMKAFDLGYMKIDACPNDCMLFWKDRSDQNICHICGASRWSTIMKNTSVGKRTRMKSAKIVRYFSLIPRLQRFFKTKKSAEEMIWHSEHRNVDGLLRHPADGDAWKAFDSQYPDFALDPRNVRLGLASDGFNLFKIMSSTYSIWPVLLVTYNMPPWVGMKHDSFILSTIIPGEKSPGNANDIYLQPLIQELCELWHGLQCYDAASGQTFNMRAALLWTINDFPAYSMLSGWSTKGRFACPCCAQNTESLWLYKGKKFSYMGHRRWLPDNHILRRQKNYFDNTEEVRREPKRRTGTEVLSQLHNIEFPIASLSKAGLKRGRVVQGIEGWKKKSIFFNLPYWEYNLLPHNLDVMHIEKNICDNFIGTLLDLEKSKDNLQARQDLVDIGIKNDLHPQILDDGSYSLPPAPFTMSKKDNVMFCEVLKNLKFPKGYASNISRCVNVVDCKIMGLKSHDCHVLLEDILPIVLSSCAPSDEVMRIVVEISHFLKIICAKVIVPTELEMLQNNIIMTLCNMEKIFLPSFFTIMIHLLVHLAEEVKLGGPVQYRWMYPFESGGITLGKVSSLVLYEKSLTQVHRYVLRHCDNGEKRKRRAHTHLTTWDVEKLINEKFHEWLRITSKFAFPGHIRHLILQSLGSIPSGVDATQWCHLVTQWSQPKDKERAIINAANAKKQTCPHTMGRVSSVRRQQEMAIKDRLLLWRVNRLRKDGTWSSEDANQRWVQACELLAKDGLTPEDGNTEANERVFSMVMGPEHPDRVRTQGKKIVEACEGEEDLSDDCSQPGEKKRRLNMEQVRTLEKNFELGNKLEPEKKMQLMTLKKYWKAMDKELLELLGRRNLDNIYGHQLPIFIPNGGAVGETSGH
ncbi:hypothetical protein KFK09_022834 [Dendrobium nobile]|uniref:DUF4218 domain-containing protein n=1 Tax=Dendrobium nobile TaxID=94219 RepID=A0A8T3AQZ9_DENNO|nr:hypothetical protein KFK09_022834 [Dendrobium nobile]